MTIIFVPLLIIAGIWYVVRTFKKAAARINGEASISYPPRLLFATVLLLLGYHIGIHSNFPLFSSLFRFPATGWAFVSLCIGAGWIFLLKDRLTLFTTSLIAVSAISGIVLPFQANGFVQSFNLVIQLIAISALYITLIFDSFDWTVSNILGTFEYVLPSGILQSFRQIKTLVKHDGEKKQKLGGWIKTTVIVSIVLILFMIILSAADPVFAQIVKDFRTQLFGRTIASMLIILLVCGYASLHTKIDEHEPVGWINLRDIVAAVAALNILLFVFLFVQFKYLFLGNKTLLEELHLTFSEYVRKGFSEMLLATFIGGVLSWLLTIKSRLNRDNKYQSTLILLNIVLLVQLGLILASAFKRDMLYVDVYGLTRVRVIGGMFLLWLSGFLATLGLYALVRTLRESRALLILWFMALCVWGSMNVMNIDAHIAQGAPGHHLYTDYFYLMQLSEDIQSEKVNFIPQIQKEVLLLTSKQGLTDVEKYQLAGLKLALLTFVERRNKLYLYYAPEQWLIAQGWRIGLNLNDNPANNSWISLTNDIDLTYAHGWTGDSNNGHILPEWLKKIRNNAFYNKSEYRAFQQISSNDNLVFSTVHTLISDIRKYQIKNQIALNREENKLLHEFSYPFLNVEMKWYWPELLTKKLYDPGYRYPNTDKIVQSIIAAQQPTLEEMSQYTCSSFPRQELEIYALMSGYDSSLNTNIQTVTLSSLNNKVKLTTIVPASLRVSITPELKKELDIQNGTIGKTNQPYLSLPPSDNLITSGNYIFVKAALMPIAMSQSDGCHIQFVARRVYELYSL